MSALTYLLICFIISVPFNHSIYRLLYPVDGIPAGADNAFHTFSILNILETNNPLITYSQFPGYIQNTSNYYPSFFHLTVAAITKAVSVGQHLNPIMVIEVEKVFMLAISLAGTAGYALFIRALLQNSIENRIIVNRDTYATNSRCRLLHLILSLLAFSIFIFSVAPVIHTYNDGSYAQIFAMWAIFPFFMYLLVNRHWISSAILFSLIASTHNLSFLMTLAALLPFVISLLLQRTKSLRKNLLKFSLTFIVLALPAFVFFYIPIVIAVTTPVTSADNPESLVGSWPLSTVEEQIKPVLYYLGIVCTFLLLVFNYRQFGWISSWVVIYFLVFSLSPIIGARFARELSVIYGLVIGVCVGYIAFMLIVTSGKWSTLFRALPIRDVHLSSFSLMFVVIIFASLIPLWYLYFLDRFISNSNPLTSKYLTEAVEESNRFFLASTKQGGNNGTLHGDRGVIVLFGLNPWLKVTTFGKFDVLEIQPSFEESGTGGRDTRLNQELSRIFLYPNTKRTACVIDTFDIDFIYLSDRLPGRFYGSEQNEYYDKLEFFQTVDSSPLLQIEEEFIGQSQEYIRIFSTDEKEANEKCGS
jgi:hypothetical protein